MSQVSEDLDEKRRAKAIKKEKEKQKKKDGKDFLEDDDEIGGLLSDKDLNKLYGSGHY